MYVDIFNCISAKFAKFLEHNMKTKQKNGKMCLKRVKHLKISETIAKILTRVPLKF